MKQKEKISFFVFTLFSFQTFSQNDSAKNEIVSVHAQTTVITQYKPYFKTKYSGDNSLTSAEETQTSITSTLFLGTRLWKGASAYLNPEIAGGSGLSGALGVAASTNGETYRVGNPTPTIALARLFFHQVFSLSKDSSCKAQTKMKELHSKYIEPDQNQLGGICPTKYFAVTIGKISVADFFDANSFSHDPRTQFMSWGLMENGSWDYPANVKGYTPSLVLELISPKHELRYHVSVVTKSANSNDMNYDITQASGHSLEYTYNFSLKQNQGAIRILGFYNTANMGNYRESIVLALANSETPNIISTRKYGRSKYGFTLNGELESRSKQVGGFFRTGWNDGTNETWMYTEIDQTASAGIVFKGKKWKREDDALGIAGVASGISSAHRDYLQAGGKGFMLGDGNLNYGMEKLLEVYYSFALPQHKISLSAAYQHVINPGYNKDRGPVDVYSVRAHVEI
ncbi:MAG: carbohydrate porin [Bacteroidetes bacterium]|nr:carbohydrate porin [Bacteroidota bacterium]